MTVETSLFVDDPTTFPSGLTGRSCDRSQTDAQEAEADNGKNVPHPSCLSLFHGPSLYHNRGRHLVTRHVAQVRIFAGMLGREVYLH